MSYTILRGEEKILVRRLNKVLILVERKYSRKQSTIINYSIFCCKTPRMLSFANKDKTRISTTFRGAKYHETEFIIIVFWENEKIPGQTYTPLEKLEEMDNN